MRKTIVMTIVLLCTIVQGAWAQEPATIGSISYNSTLAAYEIKRAANLNDLAVYVNGSGTYSTGGSESTAHDCTGMTFKQTAGITYNYDNLAEGASNFTAIGNSSHPFNGHFDGGENTISGIRIRQGSSNCQGLFGETGTNAEVEDLTLTECNGRRLLPQ